MASSSAMPPEQYNLPPIVIVTLYVGPERKKILVQKALLTEKSPVFQAMFTHETIESKTKVVEIPDISPDIMEQLIEYARGTTPIMESIEDAQNLAIAADKYMFDKLTKICVSYIAKNFVVRDIWRALHILDAFRLPVLKPWCIKYLIQDTMECMSNKEMLDATENHILELVSRPRMRLKSEIALIRAVVKWARVEAKRRGWVQTDRGGVRRILLPRIMSKLRLLTLSRSVFLRGPYREDWLTRIEKHLLLEQHAFSRVLHLYPLHISQVNFPRERPSHDGPASRTRRALRGYDHHAMTHCPKCGVCNIYIYN